MEAGVLVGQLLYHDGQREFSRSGPGLHPEPINLFWHSPTTILCSSSYGCGTLLLRFIEGIDSQTGIPYGKWEITDSNGTYTKGDGAERNNFFPSAWTEQQVYDAIYQIISTTKPYAISFRGVVYYGVINNVPIYIVLDEGTGHLRTAFPLRSGQVTPKLATLDRIEYH